jgi:tetratricopeptide (TPR) repeat protein
MSDHEQRRSCRRPRGRLGGCVLGVSPAELLVGAVALIGCGRGELGLSAVSAPAPLEWRLPTEPGRFAPAHTQAPAGLRGAALGDDESCSTCHAEIYAQQQASAHAWSSFNNPIYRFSVESMRADIGKPASKMCGGCHDLALLVDGAMDAEVAPVDRRAHTGVTCRICHGIAESTVDGNGSVALRSTPIPLPKENDAASIEAHKKAAAPVRTTRSGLPVCGSCHRGFLSEATGNGHFLIGQDELTSWSASAWSGNGLGRIDKVERKSCIDCHMARVPAPRRDAAARNGTVASHRFAGGHTWLAAMLGDAEQLEAHRAMLRGAASIDVAGVRVGDTWHLPADGAAIAGGDTAIFDVVIRNLRVGHRFPGGVLDAQDVFVAISVTDARGDVIAAAGTDHLRGADDPSAHILRAVVADSGGTLRYARDTQNFRAPIVNHTIAARDAVATRFALAVPGRVLLPLRVEARLLHRSRNPIVARLACEAQRSARGAAFAAYSRSERRALDACVAPPVTEIARAAVVVGGEAPSPSREPFDRLYELGMALGHGVSEKLDEARAPLERALALAATDRQRAAALAQLAAVSGRQGRTDEALEHAARAEALIGPHPALYKIRGDALSRVWRWREAAEALSRATARSPGNPGGWRALAIARGSLGEHREALAASIAGLALTPRDADLLRVQALALEALDADPAVVERALDAYDEHRPPDRGADIRVECARTVPGCATERQPVHVHQLQLR